MKVEAAIHIEGPPEVTIRDRTVYCEGKPVGRILSARVEDEPHAVRLNMQIDDQKAKDAIMGDIISKLPELDRQFEEGLAELRRIARA